MPIDIHLHPMVVHFPIALFITAAVIECLSLILRKEDWHRIAVFLYIVATLITPVVVLTGLREEDELHLNHPVLSLHKQFALLTLWGSWLSLPVLGLLAKKKPEMFRWVFFVCAMVIVILVSIAAYNGGRMVYEYGVGVES